MPPTIKARLRALLRLHTRLAWAGAFVAASLTLAAAPLSHALAETPAPAPHQYALFSETSSSVISQAVQAANAATTAQPSQPLQQALLAPPGIQTGVGTATRPSGQPLRWVYMVGMNLPQSLIDHADQIDVIAPAWFKSDANGMIYGNDSPAVSQFARAHNIKIIPIVANGEFQESVAHTLLTDGNRQTQLLDSLQWLTQNFGYDGVNIDFENMSPADRDGFSALMSNVYARLHPLGKTVTAAIASKTAEKYTGFAGPYDYAALAPNLDLALIMAYDQHYSGGPAGPVADLAWVNDVVTYAKTNIPPSKLLLGVPFYGYDWGTGRARAMAYTDIVKTVFANGAQIQMNQAAQSPWFTYQGHQVWFENSESLKAKINLVNVHGLAGWGGWRLGQEDPNFWTISLSRQ